MDNCGLRPFTFVLAVRDFDATAKYFHEALGFEVKWTPATGVFCPAAKSTS